MARPRTPTQMKETSGAFKHDPQRRPQNEPTPKAGIGPAPESLSEYERECWDELNQIIFPGLLGDSDRWAVERCVKLMAKSRLEPDNFTGQNENSLIKFLAAFGMTPADRSRVSVMDTKKTENPFSRVK